MRLKQVLLKLEKYKFVKIINNCVRKLHMMAKTARLGCGEFYRRHGGIDQSFIGLKSLKNKYEGERCFILATGPSLRVEDLYSLKNEYTFGMNSIGMLFDEIEWRPTFYGIQDLHVYDKISNYINNVAGTVFLVGNNIAKKRLVRDDWVRFPLNTAFNSYQQNVLGKYPVKFSDDCYSVVYNGFSITFSLLQLAVYMGFKEIYLLGADCSFFTNKANHFIEHGHVDAKIETAQARNFAMYEKAKEYTDKHGIKIYNATRGGALEIFPRVDFDSIEKM